MAVKAKAERSLDGRGSVALIAGEHDELPYPEVLIWGSPIRSISQNGRAARSPRAKGPLDSSEGRPRRAPVRPPEAIEEAAAVSAAKLTGSTLAKFA
jgi:hypothetical protein